VVGQKHNAIVGGDMQEKIQGLRKSVAGISLHMQAPKSWIGSDDVNLFQIVCDTLDLLCEMNDQLAVHTHGPTPPPNSASIFEGGAVQASTLAAKLKFITM